MKNYENKSFFSSFLIYITLSISFTIFIVSITLYINFQNIGLSFLYTFSKDSLYQVSYSANFMTNTVKSIATQIYFGKQTSRLLYDQDMSSTDLNLSLDQLNIYRTTMPIIHSAYVYNGNAKIFYTNLVRRVYSKEEFFDKDIVSVLENFPKDKRLKPIPRKMVSSYFMEDANIKINVYTYVFFDEPLKMGKNVSKAVILNISEDWIKNTINAMDVSPESSIFIIDNNGTAVLGNDQITILSDLSEKNYIQDILKTKKNSGYNVYNVNDRKTLVTFVKSDELGWTFVKMTSFDTINKQLNDIKNKSIILCLFILIIGFFFSYLMSRKLYKPVEKIMSKIQSLNYEKKKNLNQLKQDFLNKLLNGSINLSSDSFQCMCEEYALPFSALDEFSIVVFMVDNYKNFCNNYSIQDRTNLKQAIGNIASQIFNEQFISQTVELSNDLFALIYKVRDIQDLKLCRQMVENRIKAVQYNIEKQHQISLSAATSITHYCDYSDLHSLHMELISYSNYRLFFSHKCIIFMEDIHPVENIEYNYPANKEKQFLDALLSGKPEQSKRLFDEIISSTDGYSYIILKSTLQRFIYSFSITIDTIEKSGGLSTSFNINNFLDMINDFETLDDIKNTIYIFIEQVILKLDEKRKNKNNEMIQKAIEMINSSFMNPNLSPEEIAKEFSISAIYLGRLFKKQTSKSISNYINDVRLEQAKQLLEHTDNSIENIVNLSGFSNTNYFYTLFKKSNGITPSDYRKSFKLYE